MIYRLKDFLEFNDSDAATLSDLNAIAQKYADPVIEDLYKPFLSFEETPGFFQDPATLQRVKLLQGARIFWEVSGFRTGYWPRTLPS